MSMPLWLALLLGTGFGLGTWLIISGAWPARPPLASMLAALCPPAAAPRIVTADAGGWAARAGRPAAGPLRALGLPGTAIRRDLAVLGRSLDRHLAEKAAAAVTGLLIAPAAGGSVPPRRDQRPGGGARLGRAGRWPRPGSSPPTSGCAPRPRRGARTPGTPCRRSWTWRPSRWPAARASTRPSPTPQPTGTGGRSARSAAPWPPPRQPAPRHGTPWPSSAPRSG